MSRVLSIRSGVIHGFCDRALTLPSCPVSMWSRSFECAPSSVCLVLCWSVVFGSRHSCLEFRFRVGIRTLTLHVLVVWECGLKFSQPRVLLSTCVVFCGTQFVFLLAACIHVMSCAVWHAACVFHWLRAFMLSCLVWTPCLWVFSLATCLCPVLHMAGDLCLCFVWAHGFCLSFLCAMCPHVNCFDPTHLVTWILVPYLSVTTSYVLQTGEHP